MFEHKKQFSFTLWDVGHGISIWIRTPNGRNHWIDLGRTSKFSPAEFVARNFRTCDADFLIISYPDKNHLGDLPSFRTYFRNPEYLCRNETTSENGVLRKYRLKYRREYADLRKRFAFPCSDGKDPRCPSNNGGIRYRMHGLDHGTRASDVVMLGSPVIEKRNTSVVVMLLYAGVLFVCPGDIEPLGWRELWHRHSASYEHLIARSHARFLVAPRRGHKSVYSEDMMQAINPHAVFISDIWRDSKIHPSYRSDPIGTLYRGSGYRRYFSTRRTGHIHVLVLPSGEHSIHQYNS